MTSNQYNNVAANAFQGNSNQFRKINNLIKRIEASGLIGNASEFTLPFSGAFQMAPPQQSTFEYQQIMAQEQMVQQEANALDQRIAELEKKAKKSKKGFFSGIYNMFSKKDNKLNDELKELKAVRAAALADDGRIDANELRVIKKEFNEANESLGKYKDGKKSTANLVSTVAAIGAGIVVGALLAPVTGGASLAVVAAGIATTAVAGGITKVATKEMMLGDEYEALGKEGMKDFAVSAAYAATGGTTAAITKGASLAVQVGVGAVGDVGITLAVDEEARNQVAEGNFSKVAIIAASGAVFRGGMGKISAAQNATGFTKGVQQMYNNTGGKIVLSGTNYTARTAFYNGVRGQ